MSMASYARERALVASGTMLEARSLTTKKISSVSTTGEVIVEHDGTYQSEVYDDARIDGAKITLYHRTTEVLSVQCDWSPAGVRKSGNKLPGDAKAWIPIDRVEIPSSFDWVVSKAERAALCEIFETFSDTVSVAHKTVKEFDGPWDLDSNPPLSAGIRTKTARGLYIGLRLAPSSVKSRPDGVPVIRLPVTRCELVMASTGNTVRLFAGSKILGTWSKANATKNVLRIEGIKGEGYELIPEKSMFTALVELAAV